MLLLAGGETTVIVRGDGVGGRNQELVLSFALQLHLSQPEIVRAGYQVEWSTLIGRDCRDPVLSLVEPYYLGLASRSMP